LVQLDRWQPSGTAPWQEERVTVAPYLDAKLAAIAAYQRAAAAEPSQPSIFDQIGLWNADPDASLAAAASAFTEGDLRATVTSAALAEQIWTSAESIGRNRVIAVGLSVAAFLLGLWLVSRWYRDRRVRRRRARSWRELTPG